MLDFMSNFWGVFFHYKSALFINTISNHEGQLGRLGCMGCDVV